MVTSLLSSKALRAKYLTAKAYARAFSSKRTAVVVGATGGIGQACARRLAQQGFTVLAVGRDRPGRAEEVVADLEQESKASTARNPIGGGGLLLSSPNAVAPEHEFYPCNAFSLASVQETAEKIMQKHQKIDALIMTQGMATTQGFTPTSEGNDEKLTLHYYSRVCLTRALLPALNDTNTTKNTDNKSQMPAVVLTVLSGGVHGSYDKYQEDFELRDNYSIQNAANAAGYYNDLAFDHLALQNPKVKFFHASPGFVNTNWGTEFNSILRSIVRVMQVLGRSPEKCAEYLMGATVLASDAGEALPDRPNDDGIYVIGQNGEPVELTKAHTPEARNFVWKHTMEVLEKAGIGNVSKT